MARTHTQYTRANSPWNRKALIWLWSFQTIGSIIVTAFAAALHDRRDVLQKRYDDGLADALFLITAYLVFSFTALNVILMIPTYFHYKKDTLSPMWMMIGSVWLALFWLAAAAMAIWSIAWSAPTFQVFEVCDILIVLAAVPYLGGLVYYSVVYHGWRKARKVDIETTNERYSLDSRKAHAVNKH
ncbi:hypothetical protein VTL71DRAFT_5058 [Oculimacula yallundae]|uniref:MARVEL domain-containing protein n=1 Tax=Oculimacula yallundae TaxID=86028 RepID=A0ABR4C029_9HELO